MKNLFFLILLQALLACFPTSSHNYEQTQKASVTSTSSNQGLTITYIANEGVFLQKGNKKVLIDALHERYRPEYMYPSDHLRTQMEQGKAPFNDMDLVLVSHIHADHFGASTCARQLKNNPKTVLIGSSQIRDSLRKTVYFNQVKNQLKIATRTEQVTINQIPVKILKIAHGWPSRHGWVKNFGYVVDMDGQKVLHIGDARLFEPIFKELALQKENIEVAILPMWFNVSEEGKKLVEKYIRPKHIIASHISVGDEKQSSKRIKKYFPKAITFTKSGQKSHF